MWEREDIGDGFLKFCYFFRDNCYVPAPGWLWMVYENGCLLLFQTKYFSGYNFVVPFCDDLFKPLKKLYFSLSCLTFYARDYSLFSLYKKEKQDFSEKVDEFCSMRRWGSLIIFFHRGKIYEFSSVGLSLSRSMYGINLWLYIDEQKYLFVGNIEYWLGMFDKINSKCIGGNIIEFSTE